MKKTILILISFYLTLLANNNTTYKIVPIISSNPTAGTGGGLMATAMYSADNNSSPSQTIFSAQYTDTDSYNIFFVNKLFFSQDKWQSNTVYAHIFNNTEFSISTADLPLPNLPDYFYPGFEVKIDAFMQQFMYLLYPRFYIGGHFAYIAQNFSASNQEGKIFLNTRGIESSKRGGIGMVLSYDTRSKQEKFYPKDSTLINLNFTLFPSFLGTDIEFSNFIINARHYIPLFHNKDVLALQYVGQFCSKDTPDGALAALGARNVLRGFPIGKYKTRYMNAIQSEYRYTITNTRFRLAPFIGYARLDGGSKGTDTGNRDKDNGNYYSGGIGLHYILSKKHQLDYRLDLAYSSDDEVSVYATLNQAF